MMSSRKSGRTVPVVSVPRVRFFYAPLGEIDLKLVSGTAKIAYVIAFDYRKTDVDGVAEEYARKAVGDDKLNTGILQRSWRPFAAGVTAEVFAATMMLPTLMCS